MRRDPNQIRTYAKSQRGTLTLTNGIWRLRYREPKDDNGRRAHKCIEVGPADAFHSYDAVRAEADRLLDIHAPRRLVPGASLPWSAWCARFERDHLPLVKHSSRITFRSLLHVHIKPSFLHLHTHEITQKVIQEWVAAQAREGTPRNTISSRFSLLRLMLHCAKAAGLAAEPPPPRAIRMPRTELIQQLELERAFSAEQATKIMQEAQPLWFSVLLMLLSGTGMRINEALALQVKDIDLERFKLHVRKSVSRGVVGTPKSGKSIRAIPLADNLCATLELFKDHAWQELLMGPSHNPEIEGLAFEECYLFSADGGLTPRDANGVRTYHLRPLLKRLGMPVLSFHGFRHMAAEGMFASGAEFKAVSAVLGHSSLKQTGEYVKARQKEERIAVNAISLNLPLTLGGEKIPQPVKDLQDSKEKPLQSSLFVPKVCSTTSENDSNSAGK